MTTRGVGVDLVDVTRFALALERRPALVARLFTERERAEAHERPERLAARFAAKEAVLKSLGVGLGAAPWHAIEIRRSASGAPRVHLRGAAAALARERGVGGWYVSLSHTGVTAAAFVVASAEAEVAGAG